MKPVSWRGSSFSDLSEFPAESRRVAGFELWKLQSGDEPSDWKPMSSVGIGVIEVRVRIDGAFRVICLATLPEAVYVLHAFQKKSRKTAKPDLDLARKRYRDLIAERRTWRK